MSSDRCLDDVSMEEGSVTVVTKQGGRLGHNRPLLILTLLMAVVYCVSLLLPNSERWGWLPNSVGNASDAHPTAISPADWAFLIWIVIFMWQMLWLVYVLINLCRRNDHGPVYLNPPVINLPFVISYIVSLVAISVWYFVWCYEIIWAAFAVIVIIPVSVWTCIVLLTRGLARYEDSFSRRADLWIYRILVLNGLSIFGTWTALATHINLAMMITYDFGASIATGSTVAFVIVLLLVIAYIFLDLHFWDRYLRYNLLSFPVIIWALSAIIWGRKQEAMIEFDVDANFVLAIILLSVGCVAFVLKVVLLIVRSVRDNRW